MRKIISRQEAKEKGFTRYFTGEKCSKGHIDEKLVCNWTCLTCKQLREKEWRKKNYEKRITQCRKSGSKWRETHFEVNKLRRKNWKKKRNIKKKRPLEKAIRLHQTGTVGGGALPLPHPPSRVNLRVASPSQTLPV